jgi:hypothetical protein
MKRTAEQVVQEWRDSGSQDWGQLVSAINYWAMTDICPELNAGAEPRDWVTQLDDLHATLAYHEVPFKDRAEAFEKFLNRYRAALAKEARDAGAREACELPWAIAEMGPITVDVLKGLAEESKQLHPYMSLIYHSWIAQRLNHLVFHAIRAAAAWDAGVRAVQELRCPENEPRATTAGESGIRPAGKLAQGAARDAAKEAGDGTNERT